MLLDVESLEVGSVDGRLCSILPRLVMEPGEMAALAGPSGVGKSLAALALVGLLPRGMIARGRADFHGRDLLQAPDRLMDALRGAKIGLVAQDAGPALDPYRPCGDQLDLVLRIHGVRSRAARSTRIVEWLSILGFDDADRIRRAFPHQLSGGEQQRVAFARAAMLRPELIILDEPTASLDLLTESALLSSLLPLRRDSGTSILLITHDMKIAESADRVVRMGPPQAPPRRRSIASTSTAGDSTVLRLTDVRKSYGTAAGRTIALDHVNLVVHQGEAVGLAGPSGSGKTTLARIACGLLRPDGGQVEAPPRPSVQLIFQSSMEALDPLMSLGDSLDEALAAAQVPAGERARRTVELLASVGLDPAIAERVPSQVSGGQRQRVAIARALAAEPRLIIADEPTSALDELNAGQVMELLASLRSRSNISLILISHDLDLLAHLCDRTVTLKDGRAIGAKPPAQ